MRRRLRSAFGHPAAATALHRAILSPTNPKPRPDHQLYVEALRRLTPEQRLLKAFELTELTRELLSAGVRQRPPEADEAEPRRIYLGRLEKCH